MKNKMKFKLDGKIKRNTKQLEDAQDKLTEDYTNKLAIVFDKLHKYVTQVIDPLGKVKEPTITKAEDFKINVKDELGNILFELNADSYTLGMEQSFMDLGLTGSFDIYDADLIKLLKNESVDLASSIEERVNVDLQNLLSNAMKAPTSIPGIAERIMLATGYVTGLKTWQAERIAQTEVIGRCNQAHFQGYADSGLVDTKTWAASPRDGHTRPAHLEAHGQEVNINDPFIVMGEPLMYPGDKRGSAKNIIRCRCRVGPGTIKEITTEMIDAIIAKYGDNG